MITFKRLSCIKIPRMRSFIKPLFSVAIISTLLFIAGCGEDPEPASIVGKWELASAKPEVTVPGGVTLVDYLVGQGIPRAVAEEFEDEILSSDIEFIGQIEFKDDGKYEGVDDTDPNDIEEFVGTWELSSDRKTLVVDKNTSSEITFEVTTLTGADLVLDLDMTDEVGFAPNTIEYHAILTFKRL